MRQYSSYWSIEKFAKSGEGYKTVRQLKERRPARNIDPVLITTMNTPAPVQLVPQEVVQAYLDLTAHNSPFKNIPRYVPTDIKYSGYGYYNPPISEIHQVVLFHLKAKVNGTADHTFNFLAAQQAKESKETKETDPFTLKSLSVCLPIVLDKKYIVIRRQAKAEAADIFTPQETKQAFIHQDNFFQQTRFKKNNLEFKLSKYTSYDPESVLILRIRYQVLEHLDESVMHIFEHIKKPHPMKVIRLFDYPETIFDHNKEESNPTRQFFVIAKRPADQKDVPIPVEFKEPNVRCMVIDTSGWK